MKDLIIKIPASKIKKLAKQIAIEKENHYLRDFKYEDKGLKELEKQVLREIKKVIKLYVLNPDTFLDNNLINWNIIPARPLS